MKRRLLLPVACGLLAVPFIHAQQPVRDGRAVATAIGTSSISGTLVTLRALPPPEGDAEAVAAIWSKVDVLLDDYEALSAALRDGATAQVDELDAAAQASQAAANEASIAYGLTVCGS